MLVVWFTWLSSCMPCLVCLHYATDLVVWLCCVNVWRSDVSGRWTVWVYRLTMNCVGCCLTVWRLVVWLCRLKCLLDYLNVWLFRFVCVTYLVFLWSGCIFPELLFVSLPCMLPLKQQLLVSLSATTMAIMCQSMNQRLTDICFDSLSVTTSAGLAITAGHLQAC